MKIRRNLLSNVNRSRSNDAFIGTAMSWEPFQKENPLKKVTSGENYILFVFSVLFKARLRRQGRLIYQISVVLEITQNPCLAAVGWSLVPSLGPSTLHSNRAFQPLHLLDVGFGLTRRSEPIKGSFLTLCNQHLSVLFCRLCTWPLVWPRVASLCIFYAAVLSNPNEKWQDSSISFLLLFPSSSPSPIPFFPPPWALLASLVSVLYLLLWVMPILCNCFWKAEGKHRRADW